MPDKTEIRPGRPPMPEVPPTLPPRIVAALRPGWQNWFWASGNGRPGEGGRNCNGRPFADFPVTPVLPLRPGRHRRVGQAPGNAWNAGYRDASG